MHEGDQKHSAAQAVPVTYDAERVHNEVVQEPIEALCQPPIALHSITRNIPNDRDTNKALPVTLEDKPVRNL